MLENKNLVGFTLIELLVVIGVISILASIVLVAVNPGREFANARDTQRRSDLYSITNAIYQYSTENSGNLPEGFPEVSTCIGNTTPCYDISTFLIPTYITEIPADPTTGTSADTDYYIFLNNDGRLQVSATSELTGQPITIQR